MLFPTALCRLALISIIGRIRSASLHGDRDPDFLDRVGRGKTPHPVPEAALWGAAVRDLWEMSEGSSRSDFSLLPLVGREEEGRG